eukprot:5930624-Pyramimonas_sp.AAC.2
MSGMYLPSKGTTLRTETPLRELSGQHRVDFLAPQLTARHLRILGWADEDVDGAVSDGFNTEGPPHGRGVASGG